jgi:hypothetical protein
MKAKYEIENLLDTFSSPALPVLTRRSDTIDISGRDFETADPVSRNGFGG